METLYVRGSSFSCSSRGDVTRRGGWHRGGRQRKKRKKMDDIMGGGGENDRTTERRRTRILGRKMPEEGEADRG